MKNPSVALRVILFLIAAQLPALIITWALTTAIGLTGFSNYDLSLDELALPRTDRLVIDSLVRGNDGRIRVEATPELRAEMRRVPGLRFAVFDPDGGKPIEGSAPELVASLKEVMRTKPVHLHFARTGAAPREYLGHLDVENTPFWPATNRGLRAEISMGRRFLFSQKRCRLERRFFIWRNIVCRCDRLVRGSQRHGALDRRCQQRGSDRYELAATTPSDRWRAGRNQAAC
jgi:hypothetical protein